MGKYQWDRLEVERLRQLILTCKRIVVLPHTSPDGDALGSILAWVQILRAVAPEANVQAISPDYIENYLSWLPLLHELIIYPEDEAHSLELIRQADLIFHLDHNEVGRLRYPPLVKEIEASSAERVLIDHHLFPEAGCSPCFSYPEASATCELVYLLAKELGWKEHISPEASTLLLTGIITDTGRFMYSHLSPELFSVTSELLALGADYPFIIDRLSYHNPEAQIRLQGYVLDRKLELYPELGAAVITLSQSELQEFGATKGDTEGLVNIPLSIEGISSSCFIREDKTQIKLSLRSTGDFPVHILAQEAFGGGGHQNAAGAEHIGTIEEAKNIYLCQLKGMLRRYPLSQEQ